MIKQSPLEKNRAFSDKISQGLKNPEIPEMILEAINPAKKILDLGCGEGGIISAILERFPKKRITGVDISTRRIDLLKRKFPKQNFLCGDITNTPLKSKMFDLIICTQVIEYVGDDKKLIEEFYRLLKKGGFLYASSVIKKPWAIYKYRNNGKFVLDPTHEREYSSERDFLKKFEDKFQLIKMKKYQVKRKFLSGEIRIPGYFTIDSLWKIKK
jgi:ubiquinone/menaquinone biosynthesis C-methylase UbiE